MIIKNSEYVLGGHPDRITDGIAETIAMAIFNLDGWDGRSAAEALYVGNNFAIGGEFKTSLNDESFATLIEWITKRILSKQSDQKIKVIHLWQKQSAEIFNNCIGGWGDNTIAYGFCSKEGQNITKAHKDLRDLGEKITNLHQKELPDGKLIRFNQKTTISIEDGISLKDLSEMGVENPTLFAKSGANADSGVVGRKLIAERHGNGVPHGGGAFTGKDYTKGDKTLKLIADDIACEIWEKTKEETLIQVSTKFGSDTFYIETKDPNIDLSQYQNKNAKEYWEKFNELYAKYSPVKPSHFLSSQDIKELEDLLLKISGKEKLLNKLW